MLCFLKRLTKRKLTLPAGNYQISIIYNGNTNYLSSNANFIITSLSSIESNNLKRGYNSDYDFKAKFLDKSGQALINAVDRKSVV